MKHKHFQTRTVSNLLASVTTNNGHGGLQGYVYEPNGRMRHFVNWDDEGEADTNFFHSISTQCTQRPMNERWDRLTPIQREELLAHTRPFDEFLEMEFENRWKKFWLYIGVISMCLVFCGSIEWILS